MVLKRFVFGITLLTERVMGLDCGIVLGRVLVRVIRRGVVRGLVVDGDHDASLRRRDDADSAACVNVFFVL